MPTYRLLKNAAQGWEVLAPSTAPPVPQQIDVRGFSADQPGSEVPLDRYPGTGERPQPLPNRLSDLSQPLHRRRGDREKVRASGVSLRFYLFAFLIALVPSQLGDESKKYLSWKWNRQTLVLMRT